jgi:GNAT superfamily N-acetyltransferase
MSGEASEAQVVRPLRPGDAGRVAQLLEQLGYPAGEREVRKRIGAWARDDRGVAFGVIVDDGLAGCAAVHVIPFFERPGARARLVALVVDAEYRRRGIASVLVEHCRNFARQHGATEIEVTSRRTRTDADRFYTGAGFADVTDRSRRYISDLSVEIGAPSCRFSLPPRD